jgi:predicted transposase/invertase (TIGR01784 family)
MQPHDNAYKNLFSHPDAVRDLLRGFVHEDWVELLDFDSLEKVSNSYVTDDLRDREDDIIWRIRMRPSDSIQASTQAAEWLYVYLLIEFQSGVDPYMAVRILTYLGLLYQDLIKGGKILGGKLPAVFPLVLYNGERAWTAPREVSDLIEAGPASLAAYRPQLRYFLLDEGRVPEEDLEADNAIASVVRLERSNSPQEIEQVVGQLAKRLQADRHRELRRALTVWINRVVLRRFKLKDEEPPLQDLQEIHHMISERVERWTEQWLQQGVQQGMQQGQAQSLRRLLSRRFGPLPEKIESQIGIANLEQLEIWLDNFLDAQSLDAVFQAH